MTAALEQLLRLERVRLAGVPPEPRLFADRLIDIVSNGTAPTGKWQEPGQHSLVLGRVWEIEPVPCSGGRGMCALGACAACGHIGSIENKAAPLVCRRCKVSTPRDKLGRPTLKLLREYSPTGEPQAFSLVAPPAAAPAATVGQCSP